jgi:STE24 endopeptidase
VPRAILLAYVVLRLVEQAAAHLLAAANRRFYSDPARQREAAAALGLSEADMARALAYSLDRYRFARLSAWSRTLVEVALIAVGGLGLVETVARSVAGSHGAIATGLAFFGVLGLLGAAFDLPFDAYETFVIEARHGFNRQTARDFVLDVGKGLLLAAVLGGAMLAAVMGLMVRAGAIWWLWAWGAVSGFAVLVAWIYPRVLAPLFNRFTPLPDGELKERILALAGRIGFRAGGIFVMDASRRTSHGNAYFTGVLGEKRIVLFDTLLADLTPGQVVAVLAHELGHYRLHHVRWSLVRGVAGTGVAFGLLALLQGVPAFYTAFGLRGPSPYGALVVFGLWSSAVGLALLPLRNWISRRNELAADTFAVAQTGGAQDLGSALLSMGGKSRQMPISHPLFSRVYHSHPPLLERLQAMKYGQ